jgi:hypothetical protein
MALSLSVQVPVTDREELQQLVESLAPGGRVVESRPFDGEAVVQTLLVLLPSTFPFFHTWIKSRSERAKNTYLSVDGMRLKGFTAGEVSRIAGEIRERLGNDDSELDR